MKFKKISIFFTSLLITSAFLPSLAFAQSPSPNRPGQKIREAVKEARCTVAEGRINFRINRFNGLKDDHVRQYQAIKDSLSKLADRLDKQGYDTSKIRADYQVLSDKIVKRTQDYVAFVAKLENTKQYACGNSNGQFLDALKESRALLVTVRQDTIDIRNYYVTVIRKDIQELKAQKRSPKPSASPTI